MNRAAEKRQFWRLIAPYRALVEYTEFSRAPLAVAAYEAALDHYSREVLGLGMFSVERLEQGMIPVTDARFPRRSGSAVFRIGTAGGATRPATGYTFATVQRQSRAIAAALREGPGECAPCWPWTRSCCGPLDTGRIDGPDFFTGPLDGCTSAREERGIGLCTPVGPMLRTAAELPFMPRRAHPPLPRIEESQELRGGHRRSGSACLVVGGEDRSEVDAEQAPGG